MTPALRCESRRPGGSRGWRFSLAAVIVGAALLDVLWWIPTYGARPRGDEVRAPVPMQVARCRRELERRVPGAASPDVAAPAIAAPAGP